MESTETPVRTMSARDAAERLGKTSRAIQKWCSDEEAPHRVAASSSGAKRIYVNFEEFRAWCIQAGKIEDDPDDSLFDPPERPGDEPSEPRSPSELMALAGQQLQSLIEGFADSNPTVAAKKADVLKKLMNELRNLQAVHDEAELRSGTLMTRTRAAEVLVEFVGVVKSQLDAMKAELPAVLIRALADVEVGDSQMSVRVAGVSVREAIDGVESRIALQLEKATEAMQ